MLPEDETFHPTFGYVSMEKPRLVAEPLVGTEYSAAVHFCCSQATWKGNMVLSEINKTNVIHRIAFLHLLPPKHLAPIPIQPSKSRKWR